MTSALLREHMSGALAQMLDDIETLVRCESPSTDLAAVARSADVVAELGTARLGVEPGAHRRRRPHPPALAVRATRRAACCCSATTTRCGRSARSTRTRSRCGDGVLRGPGCFDMKAGLVMAFHAAAALPDATGVTLLVTGDEELGLAELAGADRGRGARVVPPRWCSRPSADGGALKIERKGVSLYEVHAHGRAAHAGLEPEAGVNATVELAHQALAVAGLDAPDGHHRDPDSCSRPARRSTRSRRRARSPSTCGCATPPSRSGSTPRCGRCGRCCPAPGERVRRPEPAAARGRRRRGRCSSWRPRLADGLGMARCADAAVGGASDGNFTAGSRHAHPRRTRCGRRRARTPTTSTCSSRSCRRARRCSPR